MQTDNLPTDDEQAEALALYATAPAMVEKGRATFAKLKPRIGLLVEACHRVLLPIDGDPDPAAKSPKLSPKGEMVVAYLTMHLTTQESLRKLVPLTAGRFFKAGEV